MLYLVLSFQFPFLISGVWVVNLTVTHYSFLFLRKKSFMQFIQKIFLLIVLFFITPHHYLSLSVNSTHYIGSHIIANPCDNLEDMHSVILLHSITTKVTPKLVKSNTKSISFILYMRNEERSK